MGNEMDRVEMANRSLTGVKAELENELKYFKARMNAKRFGTKLDVDSASMDRTMICQQYFE